MRIGLIGFGYVGRGCFERIAGGGVPGLEVAFVHNRSPGALAGVPPEKILSRLDDFAACGADLIVEMAHPEITRRFGATFLRSADYMPLSVTALADARPLSADEMPAREDRKPGLGKEGALVADLLKLLLKIRAREIDVAPKLLARSDDLEALAAGRREGLPILEGWRYEQFGHDALDLVEGRLGFAVKSGKLKMSRIEG